MTKVKAAVCREYGKPMTIEEITLRAPEPGEVEVKIDAVAVCHSDISFWQGGFGGTIPAVYGHEAAGTVTAVGLGVKGINVGDSVAVTLIRSCGVCPSCGGGHTVVCENPGDWKKGPITDANGEPLYQAMFCGAFAEKAVVDQSQVVVIPADMPKDAASLISCGVITGVGAAINTANIRPGQDVVVIGAGGVGLNAIQGARIAGARRIVAVDMNPDKLEVAKEFGATHGIVPEGKPFNKVKEIFGGRGADAVLVTVGVAAVYDQAPRYLANGGNVVMVGLPHFGSNASYSPLLMADVGQSILGSKMGDVAIKRDIPWMVDLYQQGRLKLDELISGRWTLDQINEAFADTMSGAARRNVIMID
ncbi:Zn-dependent alcohol dehydrogenase [Thalassobius vesicularis]|uniref:Zn-dependent alcohol dehydrogenase n=1 Tax=Thalassobius vesicularis TaxID=1294297 RepID=A0A4S3M740_9RHOB|nr:Zn-dependent alcohol dehydrogenase [Thalassobius vesicularis]THD72989.1 Zn-dependent alcohol dehydrogenase [Thalassobius vesicularis]